MRKIVWASIPGFLLEGLCCIYREGAEKSWNMWLTEPPAAIRPTRDKFEKSLEVSTPKSGEGSCGSC